ncbi:unnamed protein product, partial [marine sediment metagenome]
DPPRRAFVLYPLQKEVGKIGWCEWSAETRWKKGSIQGHSQLIIQAGGSSIILGTPSKKTK